MAPFKEIFIIYLISQEKKQYKALMSLTSMGFATVISTLLGFWFGLYLDGVFGTTPWLMLLFLILGVIAGFRNIYMTIKRSGF